MSPTATTEPVVTPSLRGYLHFCRAVAGLTLIVSASVLYGWQVGISPLLVLLPDTMPMAPNTAVGLALCAASVLLLVGEPLSAARRVAASFAASGAGIIGAVTLINF